MPSRISEVLEPAVHVTREEVLQRGRVRARPPSAELQPATEVLVEILLHRRSVKIRPKFEIVSSELPRETVEHLIVAVHAVTRNAAGRTELGEATHKNDRQTLVGSARACIKPN